MKRVNALLLAAILTISLAACSGGGQEENAPIQTLGWFLLERQEGQPHTQRELSFTLRPFELKTIKIKL